DDEHGEGGAVDEEQRQFEGADGLRGQHVRRGLRGDGGGEADEVEGPAAPGRERDEDDGGGGGAEGADGAEEDPGEPDRDRHPASGRRWRDSTEPSAARNSSPPRPPLARC